MDLAALIAAGDRQAIAAHLDGLDHEGRVQATRTLPRLEQERLFELAKGFLPLTVDDLVPTQLPPLLPIPHVGVNSMPMARHFAKVMFRQENGVVAGYNQQFWGWVTGPGYFTVRNVLGPDNASEVVVDYTVLPTQTPTNLPAVVSNAWGLSYFVYRDMQDTLRRVSNHVTVGHAVRGGVDLPNYFILVRGAPVMAFTAARPPANIVGAVG